jgi:hypothetical protein
VTTINGEVGQRRCLPHRRGSNVAVLSATATMREIEQYAEPGNPATAAQLVW